MAKTRKDRFPIEKPTASIQHSLGLEVEVFAKLRPNKRHHGPFSFNHLLKREKTKVKQVNHTQRLKKNQIRDNDGTFNALGHGGTHIGSNFESGQVGL